MGSGKVTMTCVFHVSPGRSCPKEVIKDTPLCLEHQGMQVPVWESESEALLAQSRAECAALKAQKWAGPWEGGEYQDHRPGTRFWISQDSTGRWSVYDVPGPKWSFSSEHTTKEEAKAVVDAVLVAEGWFLASDKGDVR